MRFTNRTSDGAGFGQKILMTKPYSEPGDRLAGRAGRSAEVKLFASEPKAEFGAENDIEPEFTKR